jgi:hypothetical protein
MLVLFSKFSSTSVKMIGVILGLFWPQSPQWIFFNFICFNPNKLFSHRLRFSCVIFLWFIRLSATLFDFSSLCGVCLNSCLSAVIVFSSCYGIRLIELEDQLWSTSKKEKESCGRGFFLLSSSLAQRLKNIAQLYLGL